MACRIAVGVFLLAHAASLLLLAMGTWGWFGAARDPLAGVYLLMLGLPWNRLLARLLGVAEPAVAVLAPVGNLLLIIALCRIGRAMRR